MARPCTISPNDAAESEHRGDGDQQQRTRSAKTLVQAFGFSNGCAELALKKPTPLVPSSLMTSWLAIGPIDMVCFAPSRVVASTAPTSVWGTPKAMKTKARTN